MVLVDYFGILTNLSLHVEYALDMNTIFYYYIFHVLVWCLYKFESFSSLFSPLLIFFGIYDFACSTT